MGGKIRGWVFATAVLGFLQVAEVLYNQFGFKLAGQIFAVCALVLAVVWMGAMGFKLLQKSRTE